MRNLDCPVLLGCRKTGFLGRERLESASKMIAQKVNPIFKIENGRRSKEE